jgi:Mg/Co/Ni transporter MgtE
VLALQQARAQGWDRCVVIAGHGTVVGILRAGRIGASEQASAAEVMQPGPTTVRVHEDLDATRQRMHDRHVAQLLVTTPDGTLIGVVDADDAG